MKLRTWVIAAIVSIYFAFPILLAEARPKYMEIFNADPYSKVEYHDRCGVCHVSRIGGGETTYFGDAFFDNDKTITHEMRKDFPHFFNSIR